LWWRVRGTLTLARELHEELRLNANVKDFLAAVVEHVYPDFAIKMHCFLVHLKEFNRVLTEHIGYADVFTG
jgi:hypothetical protein